MPVNQVIERILYIAPFFNPGDPLNHEAGEQYFRSLKKFESKARDWTAKYAMD